MNYAYKSWDIETTVHTRFKRKASPFIPENWTVTHGFKGNGQAKVEEHRFGHSKPPAGWLKPVLVNADGSFIKLLIGMNIKFDILHALQDTDNLLLWMEFVSRGGTVWDIQLAEYLLCGMAQADQMLSLDEIAPRYGGNLKVDEVKLLWQAGWMTEDIEPALLSRYLCGGPDQNGEYQKGDVENTEHVALKQIARARENGQLNSIMLNMGALLYTVEAERNGMWVDNVHGMVLADALRIEVSRMGEVLQAYMPADLPFQFNWGSPAQKSALIFGGTVQYDSYEYDLADGTTMLKDAWDLLQQMGEAPERLYSSKDTVHYVLENGGTYNVGVYDDELFSGTPDLPERVCYAGGKNAGEYKTKKVKERDLSKPKGRQCKAPYTFAGYTKPEKRWQGATPGVYSTAAEVIEELGSRNVPFLKTMAALQSMTKDLGTYFIGTNAKGEPSGLLTLVGADGLVHHMLNMVSTITARLSSSNPNLQNIPKGNKSDVKLLFKSRFGKWITDDFGTMVWVSDGKIIQSDFSSLEVYVQAILTKCKQLIADLKAGLDMHCVKLAAKEGMEYSEVLKLAKGWTDPSGTVHAPVKEWDYKRTGAKEYSFQSAFGAGDKAIAQKTGMSVEDVARLREADNERYPEIPAYYEQITKQIKANRKPTRTLPHPDFPGVMCHLGDSYFRTPDGKLYTYREGPALEFEVKRGVTASFMPTEIRNYVVQGSGGEWAKAAMWLAVRAFYAVKNFGGLGLLVNQVHDACYADAHNSVAFEVAALLHACMEGASDFMEWRFKWHVPVPVPSDTTWGYSMMDEDKIPGLKERAASLRTQLREQYMAGYVPSYLH